MSCDGLFRFFFFLDEEPLRLARSNAIAIVKYTTAYPFRLPAHEMMCVFCHHKFEDPAEFRKHMKCEHRKFNVKESLNHIRGLEIYPKVDISDLTCRVCKKDFDDIKNIAAHLRKEHSVAIISDDPGLQVFKFSPSGWSCAECQKNCPSLRVLSRHTASHYRNVVCAKCGNSYCTKRDLFTHNLKRHTKLIQCSKCKTKFETIQDRTKHCMQTKKCWKYRCHVCNERFANFLRKTRHTVEQHPETLNVFKCSCCSETFVDRIRFREHFVVAHTTKFACSFCEQRFKNKQYLKDHIAAIHTGAKDFVCDVCDKSFARKRGLVQHYWQHKEDKRFKCHMCSLQFNQKVTWKGHMRSRHPEIVDF